MKIIRKIFSLVLISSLLVSFAKAQKTKDTTIQGFFNRLPPFVNSIEEAYNIYFPKNKITPCKQYKTVLQAEMDKLADASDHKSMLLSMIAGRFEEERRRFNFMKVTISKNDDLRNAVDEMNIAFFKMQDDFLRSVGNRLDSVYKKAIGFDIARGQLKIYREEMPGFIHKVNTLLLQLDKFMNEKGYNKAISDNNSSYPYYIQILEARGVMLERISMLVAQIDGVQASAASTVDICKRFPDSCK